MFNSILIERGKTIAERQFNRPPIYIGGCARSGTTLLLSILSAHPEIHCFPKELGLFKKWSKNSFGQDFPSHFNKLYTELAKSMLGFGVNRYCEKTPKNIRYIDSIDRFHNGRFRFIHIIRDGRDVCLSVHPDKPNEYWVSPERWVKDVRLGLEFYNHPKVITLKYEELVLNFDETILKLCAFLEIPLSSSVKNWHSNKLIKKSNAIRGELKPLFSSSIGKWKDPDMKEVITYFHRTDLFTETLQQLGYQ